MKILGLIIFILLTTNTYALEKLRIGVLAFGTVNWELETIKNNNLAKKYGIELDIKKLASKNAVAIALQAGAVDIIVSDFIWVSRQRAAGEDFTYYPYSKATGGLYIRPELNVSSLLDLQDKNIGIAGGPVSKTWLIARAYSKLKYKKDLKDIIKPTFASPIILNKKVLDSSLSGAINFWHFNSKLKAKGMKNILSMKTMLEEFKIHNDIPLIGWVFSQEFAKDNKTLINSFLQASYEAKKLLNDDISQWNKIKSKMRVKNEETFMALVNGYKEGIPKVFAQEEKDSSKKVFDILARIGGTKLVGKSLTLQEGTFWEFTPSIKW